MKFIDLGLFIGLRPLRELISIRGEMEPVRCLEITEAVTAAFFDRHLKGEGLDSLDSLVQTYPDLINVELE
jgi:hypothetical protein